MPTVYTLYLQNQSGKRQNYAFFTAVPVVSGMSQDSIYSNVWIQKALNDQDYVQIQVTKTFYGWTGQSPQPLAPGVLISGGSARAVELGQADPPVPGTTLTVKVQDGSPSFGDKSSATAQAGCFEIDTPAIQPALNILCGMSANDNNGRMVPIGSFTAGGNLAYQIQPVVQYYIGVSAEAQGTAFNWKAVSKMPAHIDFSKVPGLYGATITHKSDGTFSVNYTGSRAEHLYLLSQYENESPALQKSLRSIRNELDSIKEAVGIPLRLGTFQMKGSVHWVNSPTEEQQQRIRDAMVGGMAAWSTRNEISSSMVRVLISDFDGEPLDVDAVEQTWNNTYNGLPHDLKHYAGSHPIGKVDLRPESQTGLQNGHSTQNLYNGHHNGDSGRQNFALRKLQAITAA